MKRRTEQAALIVSFTAFSWLAMMGVHELGHVVGALLSGGTVSRVALHPLAFSHTDMAANPHPLLTAWSGPVLGAVVPVSLWVIAAGLRVPGGYLFRFFAGFCLVANGVYIGAGAFGGYGDAGDLLVHGSSPWQLGIFGLVGLASGLTCWHGLGPSFGLGSASGRVERGATVASVVLLVLTALAELLFLDG